MFVQVMEKVSWSSPVVTRYWSPAGPEVVQSYYLYEDLEILRKIFFEIRKILEKKFFFQNQKKNFFFLILQKKNQEKNFRKKILLQKNLSLEKKLEKKFFLKLEKFFQKFYEEFFLIQKFYEKFFFCLNCSSSNRLQLSLSLRAYPLITLLNTPLNIG